MTSKQKKYTLFKSEAADGSVPPCAFFLSPAGCRNGDKCKFAHVPPSSIAQTLGNTTAISSNNSTSSSDLSSESENEATPIPSTPPPQKKVNKTTPKPKATHHKTVLPFPDIDDIFVAPGNTSMQAKMPGNCEEKKTLKRKNEHSDMFAKPKHMGFSTPSSASAKSKKKLKVSSSFRDLNLPVASFSTPKPTDNVKSSPQIVPVADTPPPSQYPIPSSTSEGIKWQNAVVATRNNPKYKSEYDFERVKRQMDESRQGFMTNWVKARPFGAWCANNPPAIAIDCEMCETKDPVSGASNSKALCRLSVVNACNPDEVLIDTLVKPMWPVVDYRSKINGIKKEHLESVQFTLQHAQAFMTALCSNETVIIGHALHNDLISLQMEHHCNVDSALLFTIKDEPNATCSLKDLAMSAMKREMPEVHDSVNDARVALLSIQAGYLEKGGNPEPIVRSFPSKRKGGSSELFVHRIPKGCFQEHISKMFLAHTHIQPKQIPAIEFNSDTGKTTVLFASNEHANLVFKTLEGEAKPDKTGRLQKRVYLRNGGYVCIRKMTAPKNR